MRIVINVEYGDFGLSLEAMKYIVENENIIDLYIPNKDTSGRFVDPDEYEYCDMDVNRNHPRLLEYIERFGIKATGAHYATLEVVEFEEKDILVSDYYTGIERVVKGEFDWVTGDKFTELLTNGEVIGFIGDDIQQFKRINVHPYVAPGTMTEDELPF